MTQASTQRRKGAPIDAIVRFRHRLEDTGLFTDEALAQLIDEQPRDRFDVLTMRKNPPGGERWTAGEAGGLSGAEIIEAVRTGALWVSCRRAMDLHPRYKPVFEQMIADHAQALGVRVLSASASVLISGPQMGIFFHADAADTMLWHLRGTKTMLVYPATEGFIPERAMEDILLKENLSDAPYDEAMDAAADRIVFQPGEAAAWPLHAPHRVLNGDCLNVSISVEYTTVQSALTNGAFYTKGWLRRRLGLDLGSSRATPEAMKPLYWLASKPLRVLERFRKTVEKAHPRCFDIDPTQPDNIRWRPGYGPVTPTEAPPPPRRARTPRKTATQPKPTAPKVAKPAPVAAERG